jgi:5-methyltetrahydrofolate--homocysteine methyltransferase
MTGENMPENLTTVVTSDTKTVEIQRGKPTVIIGERINPTGRKKMLQALMGGDFELVKQDAIAQVEAGAKIIDVNAGVPDADEEALFKRMLSEIQGVTDIPLCLDTADAKVLESALSLYEGKALINSINGEEERLESVLPLVKEYEASVIALCMDDDGIPPTPEERFKVAAKIIERADKLDIPPARVVVDPLALTLGSDHTAGQIAIETIKLVVDEFGVNTTIGASNISFGMPDRCAINATFLAMAIQAGLTCPITNPLEDEIITAIRAADLIMGRDEYGMNWIKSYRNRCK